MDVRAALENIYLLEEVRLLARLAQSPAGAPQHLKMRLWRASENLASHVEAEAQKAQKIFIESAARAFYEYIFLASVGEARHAEERCDIYIPRLQGGDRSACYRAARRYSPERSLPALLKLFRDGDWSRDFGGASWARIVLAGMRYQPTLLWLDSVVDLSHNNGLFLNKPTGVMHEPPPEEYFAFLNWKATGSLLADARRELCVHPFAEYVLKVARDARLILTLPRRRVREWEILRKEVGFGGEQLPLPVPVPQDEDYEDEDDEVYEVDDCGGHHSSWLSAGRRVVGASYPMP